MVSHRPAIRLVAGLLLAATLATPAFAVSGTVDVNGSKLRLRSEANTDSSVLKMLAHGTQVEILETLENGWHQVSVDGLTGYVSGEYLDIAEDEASAVPLAEAPAEMPAEAEAPAEAQPIYLRINTATLNVRSGPGTDYDKVGKLNMGRMVQASALEDGWYQIDSGYISADYVIEVDAATAQQSGKGQEIADYALQFLGYPYVYGGSSPKGFDCSGFTSYIYKQFGYSLNRTASGQLDNGYAVSRSELQPGDLVLFTKPGSTKRAAHVGLYIGNNQYIHASSPKVGVIITELDSPYSSSILVGVRRIV